MSDSRINITIKATDGASRQIKDVNSSVDELGKKSTGSARKTSLLGDVGRKAFTAVKIAAAAATTALTIAGSAAIKSAGEYEQSRVAFDTMLGSAEKGKKMLADITKFARKTPFDLPGVVDGAKRLLAYNIEGKKIIPTLNTLGNIAAGVGRDKLPQLILAFGQVRAAGKLTGAELRQFTEAGVPLLDELAKQSGKSAAQIKEDMEDGAAPSFREVEKALSSLSGRGGRFFNLMERQSKTFDGVMSNVKDRFGEILRAAVGMSSTGEIVKGSFFDKLKDGANEAMDALENIDLNTVQSAVSAFGTAMVQAISIVKSLTTFVIDNRVAIMTLVAALLGGVAAFKLYTFTVAAAKAATAAYIVVSSALTLAMSLHAQGLGVARAAWLALNIVMRANPIGLVVTAVGVLVGALGVLAFAIYGSNRAENKSNNERQRSIEIARNLTDAENKLKTSKLDLKGANLAVERSQRSYNEAVRQYGPKSLEAREAAYNLRRAKNDLKDKEYEVRDATNAVTAAQRVQNAWIDKINRKLENLNGKTFSYSIKGTEYVAKDYGGKTGKVILPKFASGTSYSPGGTTLVGERGPELVNLPRGSQVTQAWKTREMASQAPAGGNTYIFSGSFTFENPQSAEAFWNRADQTGRLAARGMAG